MWYGNTALPIQILFDFKFSVTTYIIYMYQEKSWNHIDRYGPHLFLWNWACSANFKPMERGRESENVSFVNGLIWSINQVGW